MPLRPFEKQIDEQADLCAFLFHNLMPLL